jgi:LuxR family maltose regulon positive regulatory protein
MTTRKHWTLTTTKLHRPAVTAHLVTRPRLAERLQRGIAGPITLVSASVGYGKTTLVSAWLEAMEASTNGSTGSIAAAWLSLDEHDSDLTVFVRYFCAALRTVFPEACIQTLALLKAPTQAPLTALAATLSNELAALPRDCILVLDDYHAISGVDVPDLLTALLRHWPHSLHLVLITRRDPPLPLARLRVQGSLIEIRTRDLRFTAPEVEQYVTGLMGQRPSEAVIERLERQSEGWIAGVHLATLTLPYDVAAGLDAAKLDAAASSAAVESDTNITARQIS